MSSVVLQFVRPVNLFDDHDYRKPISHDSRRISFAFVCYFLNSFMGQVKKIYQLKVIGLATEQ